MIEDLRTEGQTPSIPLPENRITIRELPEFWQEKVRSLRAENRGLRQRLKEQEVMDNLPESWQKRIRDMRRESARYRTDLREAQTENLQLRSELGALRAKVGR